MAKFNLNQWLRKTPQPVAILADDRRVEVPKHGRSWKELTTTIEAMAPEKLVALDGQGDVIRSVILDQDAVSAAPSPEFSDVQLFAKLIAEAYEKGTKSYEPLLNNAMQFVERQGQRLSKAESEIERLRNHIHKLTQQLAELAGQPIEAEGESVFGILASAIAQKQLADQAKGNGRAET